METRTNSFDNDIRFGWIPIIRNLRSLCSQRMGFVREICPTPRDRIDHFRYCVVIYNTVNGLMHARFTLALE